MSTKYRFQDGDIPHFITLTLVEWIDLFSREKYKELIIENLKHYQESRGLLIHAYVIMTNHLHLIVSTDNGSKLENIIRDFKRYTARTIYTELKNDIRESRRKWLIRIMVKEGTRSSSNSKFKVWIHENHPVVLVDNFIMEQRMKYIHNNPVKAGICYTPEDYKYSSAGDYAGEKGLLDIVFIE